MKPILGWEQAAAYTDGAERVPAGGHVCRIVTARVETLTNGSEKLSIALEIADGTPLDGIFRRQYTAKSSGNPAAKWPCVFSTFLLGTDGLCNPWFKGLIKCIEESNPGYVWAWDETTLKGRVVGMIFREEEFLASDSSVKTATRPAFARSVARIREGVEIPEIKRLPQTGYTPQMPAGFTEVQDEELPF